MQTLQKGYVLAANCPSRPLLQHMTSRWGGLVLFALIPSPLRFGELRRKVEGISERMLTQTLQQLERDGLILRKSFDTVPPHVEYRLSPFGQQAAEKLSVLIEWLHDNLPEILAAQAAANLDEKA